jgi:site-specific DNA recombinase
VVKAVIYTRVSSEMQLEGYSLETQERACQNLARTRGWEVVGVYRDEAESAKTDDRPQFQALMRDGRRGLFGIVVVYKLDRFARNRRDTENYLHELGEHQVQVVSATEPQFDFTTAAGKAYLGMVSTFNQYYVDLLAENVATAKEERARRGLWNSAVPFGYGVEYKKDGGDGMAYPDPEEAEGVQLAFGTYATGQYSDADVARILNEAGYRPTGRGERALELFSKDTVTVMLRNRFYLGEVAYKDGWYEGRHEAIITEELFDRVQKMRRRRAVSATAPRTSRAYPLTGVARCARCGGRMRGSSASGLRYYRDPARDQGRECDQGMVRAREAEDALGAFLRQLTLPDNWREHVLGIVEGKATAKQDRGEERARIEGRLGRLKRLFVLGDLKEGEYRIERDHLRAQLEALRPPVMPDLERAAELFEDFGAIWDEATPKERKQIVHCLLETVYLDAEEGPVVAVEPRPEFAALFEVLVVED